MLISDWSSDVCSSDLLNDSLGAFVGANMLYNSKTNSTLGVASSSVLGSFKTVDLRAGIKALDERWSVSVWGRNVFNEYYWTNKFVTQDFIVFYEYGRAWFRESVGKLV